LTWAIETKQTEIALKMVRKLDWFWMSGSEHTEGRQWLQRGLEMSDTPFHPAIHAEMLTQLAHHIFLVGEHEQRPFIDQALLIARENNDKHNMARALSMLGLDLTDEENYVAAQSAFEESAALYQEVQDAWGLAHAMMCLAYKFSAEEDFSNALSRYRQALAACRKTGDRYLENVIFRGMAIASLKQNDLPSALDALRESLILAQQLDTKLEIAANLSRWGSIEQRAGRQARAVCLYWAAKNLFELVGAWPQRYEFDLERELAPGRAALGEEAFSAAVEEGRAMTMEQAIAYALEGWE
jgi:tetratricopeptide (TPR) repeat protein